VTGVGDESVDGKPGGGGGVRPWWCATSRDPSDAWVATLRTLRVIISRFLPAYLFLWASVVRISKGQKGGWND